MPFRNDLLSAIPAEKAWRRFDMAHISCAIINIKLCKGDAIHMAYDSPIFLEIIQPMREELTQIGFQELRTPEAVEQAFEMNPGTTLIVVNSICGCAAGIARPAVAEALAQGPRPDHLVTVFAGQDVEATKKARTYFTNYPPSSPSIGLMKDGQFLHLIERSQIEGHSTADVTAQLVAVMQKHFQQ